MVIMSSSSVYPQRNSSTLIDALDWEMGSREIFLAVECKSGGWTLSKNIVYSRSAPRFPAFIRYTCMVTVRIRNGRTQKPVSFLFSGFAKHSSCEHAFAYRCSLIRCTSLSSS
jgi:hypothetical protein